MFNGSQKNPHMFWAIWVPIQLLRITVSRNQKLSLPKNYRGGKASGKDCPEPCVSMAPVLSLHALHRFANRTST